MHLGIAEGSGKRDDLPPTRSSSQPTCLLRTQAPRSVAVPRRDECRALLPDRRDSGNYATRAAARAELRPRLRRTCLHGVDAHRTSSPCGLSGTVLLGDRRDGKRALDGMAALCALDAGCLPVPLVCAMARPTRSVTRATAVDRAPDPGSLGYDSRREDAVQSRVEALEHTP